MSLFLDRYEGIRELLKEITYARMANIRPFEVEVINVMNPENPIKSHVYLSFF